MVLFTSAMTKKTNKTNKQKISTRPQTMYVEKEQFCKGKSAKQKWKKRSNISYNPVLCKNDQQRALLRNVLQTVNAIVCTTELRCTREAAKHEGSGRFPFDQKFRNEISGIPCDEWNSIFQLVGPSVPRFRARIRSK